MSAPVLHLDVPADALADVDLALGALVRYRTELGAEVPAAVIALAEQVRRARITSTPPVGRLESTPGTGPYRTQADNRVQPGHGRRQSARQLLTYAELADRWGVDVRTVRRRRARGLLPAVSPGVGRRGVRFRLSDVEDLERAARAHP